jgi:hypothetical protein
VSRRVEFSPEALGDLIDLYDYMQRMMAWNEPLATSSALNISAAPLGYSPIAASVGTICGPDYVFWASNAGPWLPCK